MTKITKFTAKHVLTIVLALTLIMSMLPFGANLANNVYADDVSYTALTIDGDDYTVDAMTNELINTYGGFGAVSCNNTSRLLMDYKEENPEQYWEIMNALFNTETGAGLSHIKVEMGADVNTSSGTEPATKRSADETANVLRGAGWHFIADAKSINPNVTLEALRWGEPSWTGNDYDLRYQWYKETIDAAYDTYGVEFDYISPGQNESYQNFSETMKWIKYFCKQLHAETDGRYDYSKIKIVAADTSGQGNDVAALVIADAELLELVDVIAYHYSLYGGSALDTFSAMPGKEVWYGEAVAETVDAEDRYATEPERGGVGGTSGVVDIAQRYINAYNFSGTNAHMTTYMFQPAVAAFYQGGQYNPKDIISAQDPWSGYYVSDAGIQMIRHFNQFIGEGWAYIENACYGNGTYSDGGVLVDTSTHNYLTLKDTDTDDYTMVHANNTFSYRYYELTLKNLDTSNQKVYLWETTGPDSGTDAYDSNYFRNIGSVTPTDNGDGTYTIKVTVKPYSLLTISTLENGVDGTTVDYVIGENASNIEDTPLPLPYTDDFEYSEYADEDVNGTAMSYLERRGGTPRYTNDQYGAFEVVEDDEGNNGLTQVMTAETRGYEWNVWGNNAENVQTTTTPNTILGDYSWANYTANIDFKLGTGNSYSGFDNFAGLGVRQLMYGSDDPAGYSFKVYADGSYQLSKKATTVQSGTISGFDASSWHTMTLEAKENVFTAYVDGVKITSYTDSGFSYMTGRIAILSGYYNTQYDNLQVNPIDSYAYASEKIDDANARITYSDSVNWDYSLTGGYAAYHNRTYHTGSYADQVVVQHTKTTIVQGTMNKIYYYKNGTTAWSSNNSNAWCSYTSGQEAYAELYFEGTGFDFYGNTQNASNSTADVYIDGVYHGNIDFTSGSGTTLFYSIDALTYGEHSVKLVPTGSGYVSIVRFEINDGTTSSLTLTHNDSSVIVAGDQTDPDNDPNRGQLNKIYFYRNDRSGWSSNATNSWGSGTNNSFYEVVFEGTGVELYGYLTSSNGTATVMLYKVDDINSPLVDGEVIDTQSVSLYSSSSGEAGVYSYIGLDYGYYKVRLVANGMASCTKVVVNTAVSNNDDAEAGKTYFSIDFNGTGFNLFGNSASAKLTIYVDGELLDGGVSISSSTAARDTSYYNWDLDDGDHTLRVYITEGSFTLDGIDIIKSAFARYNDKTALQNYVDKLDILDEDDYTDSSWADFQTALKQAETVLANDYVTQDQVDSALKDLKTAFEGLESSTTSSESEAESKNESGAESQKESEAESQKESEAESQKESEAESQKESGAESQKESKAESKKESGDESNEESTDSQPESDSSKAASTSSGASSSGGAAHTGDYGFIALTLLLMLATSLFIVVSRKKKS